MGMELLENKVVEKWRKLIFEAEGQLEKYKSTSDLSYEDKCVFETWE